MKPPSKSHEARANPIHESLPELFQLIDSILKDMLPSLDVSSPSAEAQQALAPSGESATIESEKNHAMKRLSEPLFLKKILLENSSGDTSELTTLALSVHAVMLESGFVLFNPDSSDDKFSFSKELFSVSLTYTLPELVESVTVTVTFQSLSDQVVVYGSLDGNVRRVCLDTRNFMDNLKYDKEGSSSIYMFWTMVKDGLVTPLLIGLCDKSGLEPPPCFTRLPKELKVKIVESLTGASLAKMACVCRETRRMASGNGLWKRKMWEEARNLLLGNNGARGKVDWKAKFACFWIHYKQKLSPKTSEKP